MCVSLLTGGKCLEEVPPIPGYKGFIPHVRTSDVGLGSRFHNMAREGYDALYSQQGESEDQGLSFADDANAVETVDNGRYVCTTTTF